MKAVASTCGIFLSAALLLSACAGLGKPAPAIDYYTLEYPPPVAAGDREKFPVAVQIRRFQVSPVYNTDRIVYRNQDFARNEYFYQRWRANPGDLLAFALERDLQHAAIFEAVFGWGAYCPCAYEIAGSVDEFLEEDHSSYWEAVLAVNITLMKTGVPDATRGIVFQKNYRARERCPEMNPAGLAAAMSRAMAEVSKQVIDDVAAALQPKIK